MTAPVTLTEPLVAAPVPHVFTAIAGVMEDMTREGIGKGRRNAQQDYNFRGIDDVYNALAPVLARHKLVITPQCLSRQCDERQSRKGEPLFYVTVDVNFTLTSALDGSSITARMYGEAMDSGDKATNKAMSAAYKYMAMQQFCIPTEGDNDADATTHQVASAEDVAINLLKTARSKEDFKTLWESHKDGWRQVLNDAGYARVVGVMKEVAASWAPAAEPKPAPKADDFGLGGDEVPAEFH